MKTHQAYAHVDIFPQHQPLAGRKCLIFGDFEQHLNFSALKNRIVDYNIECLTSKCEGTERRGMIMDFGVWVHGTPTLYGVILPADTTLNTCGIVLVSMTIPDLGGL